MLRKVLRMRLTIVRKSENMNNGEDNIPLQNLIPLILREKPSNIILGEVRDVSLSEW